MTKRNDGLKTLCLSMLAVAAPGAGLAATLADFDAFYVLGDSLSDSGNAFALTGGALPPDPPYANGRWSNGPNWADYIVADAFATKPAANYAFGNGRALTNADFFPDLPAQLAALLSTTSPAVGDPLVALWFGANDLFGAVGAPDEVVVAEAAAVAVGDAGIALGTAGYRNLLVFNLPDLGSVPAYALFQPGLVDEARSATDAFNAELDLQADRLRTAGLQVTEIDIATLFQDLLADPGAFGLTDTQTPCVVNDANFVQLSVCAPAEADRRLFFDAVHPTTRTHALIADVVISAYDPAPVPAPAAAPLLLGALGGLALWRRRVAGRQA